MKDEFYVPAAEDVSEQSEDNKQGRAEGPAAAGLQESVRRRLADGQEAAYTEYTALLADGVARELARVNLPLSLYTEWYWQIDLHNLFRFLKLRMDSHAQREIRAYATTIFEITKLVCPAACSSFKSHILGAVSFSAAEWPVLQKLLGASDDEARAAAEHAGMSGKVLDRFLNKLRTGQQL
jgi:thymidylate synthase (FAD)